MEGIRGNETLTPEKQAAIVRGIMAMANAIAGKPEGNSGRSIYESRKLAHNVALKKEAELSQALQTQVGLKKISANMANPVRFKLDYKGLFRKFVIVEQIPDGVPMIYDKDQPFVPAVKVGKGGSPRIIEMRGKRVELTAFEIAARPKVPYEELYTRRYRALDRAKDRLIEGMELREDLIGFGLIEAASALGNTTQTVAGILDKDVLAKGYNQVEKNRLVVGSVLMSTYGTMGIRRWTWEKLDQVGLQAVRETGYLGNLWGGDYYVSDQIIAGNVYVMSTPKFLGWMPLRKDTDVIPADDPDNLRLGFVGYDLLGMTIFNALAVCKVQFDPTA